MPLLTLERLTFRFVGAGFVLLTATLLAGLLFGEPLYGPEPGSWDHKTVFSVLSWLAFAVLLLGRARFGWRGRTAVRVLYTGSLLLLLAYVGSRFVLEVVLGRDRMKYLLLFAVLCWSPSAVAQRAPGGQRPAPPARAAGRGRPPEDMVGCPAAACTCRAADGVAGDGRRSAARRTGAAAGR